jgi:exopolysaccharide biosynthesis polyprenyl glycosylphosphotransferase
VTSSAYAKPVDPLVDDFSVSALTDSLDLGRADATESMRTRFVRDVEHAAAITIALLLVLGAQQQSVHVLLEVGLLGSIWFLTLRSAYEAPRLSLLAVGLPIRGLIGTGIGLAAISFIGYWLPAVHVPQQTLAVAAVAVFATSAIVARFALRRAAPRRVLAVGTSEAMRQLLRQLHGEPGLPFRFLGIVGSEEDAKSVPGTWLGEAEALKAVIREERPELVVVDDSVDRAAAVGALFDGAHLDVRLVGIHDFYEHAFGRVPVQHLSPVWFMSVLHLYQRSYSQIAKRGFDMFLAGIALILATPIMVAVALIVRVSSPGPILYRQVRSGEAGRHFEILKFRTMVRDAEAPNTAVWAAAHDPRVTRAGRVLRTLRLDELPQLWNVMRGDMSIVGPRPERPEFLAQLEESVPYWSRRHLMKPGITGWAQVRRGYTDDQLGAAEKLSYDLYYLKNRSLLLDAAIALKTAGIVVTGFGSR